MKRAFFCLMLLFVGSAAVAETKIVDNPLGSPRLSDRCKTAVTKATEAAKKASVIPPECVPTQPKKEAKK